MNKINIVYYLVVILKVVFLAYIILPMLLWVIVFIWSAIAGYNPSEYTEGLTGFFLAALVGYHFYAWILGHKQAVRNYYADKD